MKKRFISMLLVLVLLCSLLPTMALAEPPTGAPAEGSAAKTTMNAAVQGGGVNDDNPGLTVSKTAEVAANSTTGDEFDITLMVQSIQTISRPVTATVLVIDSSDSMKNGRKLNSAITAATSFVNSLHNNANGAVRHVAVVDYSASAHLTCDWEDVSTEDGRKSIISSFEKIECEGGTNMDAGLHAAYDLLNQAPAKGLPKTNKSVLLLSDGEPSYHNHQSATEWADHYKKQSRGIGSTTQEEFEWTQHGAVMVRTLANIYTIYYGTENDLIKKSGTWDSQYPNNITKSSFLQNGIATSAAHHYLAKDSDDLNQAFTAIGESVVTGTTGADAVVLDPMGEGVSLVELPDGTTAANGGFQWVLDDGQAVATEHPDGTGTTYTYTLTYQVKLDAEKQDGQWHDANGETTLTIGNQTINFPIPQLKAELDVWKDADQTDPADDVDSVTGGDGVCDFQQAVIHYISEDTSKGTVKNALDVITFQDESHTEIHGSTAQPAANYLFTGWTPGNVETPTLEPDAPNKGEEVTYTAHFTDKTYQLTYDMNGGTSEAPVDTNAYKTTEKATLVSPDGTHAAQNEVAVVQFGWTAEKDETIYTKKDTAPACITSVTFNAADETVYAVWGLDTNNNDIADVIEDKYQVTYAYTGTVPTGAPAAPTDSDIYVTGEIVEVKDKPTLTGYVLTGWTAPAGVTIADGKFTITADTELTGVWNAADDTAYTVQHYKQQKNADGSFSYPAALVVTENLTGTTGQSVTAVAKTFEGYVLTETDDTVASGVIQADGSLVLKLYYALDQLGPDGPDEIPDMNQAEILYTSAGSGTVSPTREIVTLEDEDGNRLEAKDNVQLIGSTATPNTNYKFVKWTAPDNTELTTAEIKPVLALKGGRTYTFTASFAQDLATYTEHHYYQQKNNGAYSYPAIPANPTNDIIQKTGTVGQSVTADVRNVTGYVHVVTANTVASGTVLADNSLLLKRYYALDQNQNDIPDEYEVTVTYKVVNGKWSDAATADKTVNVPLRKLENSQWVELEDAAILTAMQIPTGMTANDGYQDGAWDTTPTVESLKAGNVTYTYSYTAVDRWYDGDLPDGTGEDDEQTADGTPDIQQAKVVYAVAEGQEARGDVRLNKTGAVAAESVYEIATVTPAGWNILHAATAAPAAGYVFDRWTIAEATLEGANDALTPEQVAEKLQAGKTVTLVAHFAKERTPGLSVEKTVDSTKVEPGETVTYTITITNTGNTDLLGLYVEEDQFKVGGKETAMTIYHGKNPVVLGINGTRFDLEAGESLVLTASYKTTARDDGKTLTNEVSVTDAETVDGEDEAPAVKVEEELHDVPVLNKKDHLAYIIGYEDRTVRPENSITRAEVATIFFRLLDDSSRSYYWDQTNSFNDVFAGDWYNNAISTMENARILTGYPDGGFHPNASITRAEFAAIAARFSDVVYHGNSVFHDVLPTFWANDEIVLAEYLGWITGYPDGSFRPNQPITRAEAMTLINRVLERAVEHDHMLQGMVQWIDNPGTAWYYETVQEATNSHTYKRLDKTVPGQDFQYEDWYEILPNPDWAALERTWSRANDQ